MDNPLVSVCIFTYNQINSIAQAVDSVLIQKTKFPFNVIIGDDFSTDGTREVLLRYIEKFPDKIELNLLPAKGDGMPGHINYKTTIAKASGKYVAFLDGDDYWVDESKLQTQVDILEVNKEYSMCHHDCSSIYEGGVKLKKEFNKSHSTAGFYYACQLAFPFLSSAVVRKSALDSFDYGYWLGDMPMGDFPLWILITARGNTIYIDKEMAYYKKGKEGVSSKFDFDVYTDSRIYFFKKYLKSSSCYDRKFINRILSKFYFQSAGIKASKRQPGIFLKHLLLSISNFLKGMTITPRKYKWIYRFTRRSLLRRFAYNFKLSIKFR